MNAIGYAFQQLWFGVVRRGWWRERFFLAPESIVVRDYQDTKWQELVAVKDSLADTAVEMLIFGLMGLAMAHHLVHIPAGLLHSLHLFFSLFGF